MKKGVLLLFAASLLGMGLIPAAADNKFTGAIKRLFSRDKSESEPPVEAPTEGATSTDPAPPIGRAMPEPAAPPPDVIIPPDAEADAALFIVNLNGEKERIVIELKPEVAPKTVENFKRNVAAGIYEGMAFHRVIRNYLVQAGDPLTRDDSQKALWGTSDTGQNIPGEFKGKHRRYSVAMAHKPGESTSSASQFYITLDNAGQLDGQYAVFGEVIHGTDVLNRMSSVVVDTNDVPVRRIEIVDTKLIHSESKLAKGMDDRGLKKSKPDSAKGRLEKFIERVW